MIGKPERRILIGIGFMIVVLLLLLTYFNASAESREKTINISVIIDSPSDYLNKGMQKAANDFNVDIRPVSSGNQSKAILNELDNKADAILISAQYPDSMQTFLSETEMVVPVVTLDTRLQHPAMAAHIAVNEQQLLESLADAIMERKAEGMPCIIVKPAHASVLVVMRAIGLEEILQQRGVECIAVDSYPDTIASNLAGLPIGALVCTDPAMLQQLCEQSREGDYIFSIGYINGARQYLEDKLIKALVIYSEYDMGYLGLKAAAQAVNGDPATDTELPVYLVDGDNMYQPPINQILFPIE